VDFARAISSSQAHHDAGRKVFLFVIVKIIKFNYLKFNDQVTLFLFFSSDKQNLFVENEFKGSSD